jgi:hypothetical protein
LQHKGGDPFERLSHVLSARDLVAVEYRGRRVPGDRHRDRAVNSGADQIAQRRPTQIMDGPPRNTGGSAGRAPQLVEP